MSISNVNGATATYQYAGKTQKTSAKETTYAEKTSEASEAEKLEAFKKEIWKEINSLPRNSSVSWSINITDAAFERMMNDPEFKEKMMGLIREEAAAARLPIAYSITTIDKNGYKGYAYSDTSAGKEAYSAHSKDKDNFYKQKAKKQDYTELWEKSGLKEKGIVKNGIRSMSISCILTAGC